MNSNNSFKISSLGTGQKLQIETSNGDRFAFSSFVFAMSKLQLDGTLTLEAAQFRVTIKGRGLRVLFDAAFEDRLVFVGPTPPDVPETAAAPHVDSVTFEVL